MQKDELYKTLQCDLIKQQLEDTPSHSPAYTQTHTSAMRQESPDRINSFGPDLDWTLLNIQKVLSQTSALHPLQIHTNTHAQRETKSTYVVRSSFDLLIEFVLIFIPERRISN